MRIALSDGDEREFYDGICCNASFVPMQMPEDQKEFECFRKRLIRAAAAAFSTL